METFINEAIPVAKQLVFALLVLVIGLVIIKRVTIFVTKKVEDSNIDNTLKPFIAAVIGFISKVVLILAVVSILGIDTSSIVALLASVGFAVGLAFQGSLSNFAGGILLLINRPFKVGDFIETNSLMGSVTAISLLYTEMNTPDNKKVFLPNGELSNAAIINYTDNPTRRLDLKISVAYKENIKNVKKVITKIVENHKAILKDSEQIIRVVEHGDSSVVFLVRVWTKIEDYFETNYDLHEEIKEAFDEEGIEIPYPQMDIKIKEQA